MRTFLENALGFALFAFALCVIVVGPHFIPDAADAERRADIERWHVEGCSTDMDCEAMERELGPR